jgi:hypothetical protein
MSRLIETLDAYKARDPAARSRLEIFLYTPASRNHIPPSGKLVLQAQNAVHRKGSIPVVEA